MNQQQIQQWIDGYNNQHHTQYSATDLENYIFLNNIVAVLTGYNIAELEPTRASDLTQKCLTLFEEFVESYISEKFGKVQNLRYKTLKFYPGDSVLQKFKELGPQIDEAVVAFAEQAKINLTHQLQTN